MLSKNFMKILKQFFTSLSTLNEQTKSRIIFRISSRKSVARVYFPMKDFYFALKKSVFNRSGEISELFYSLR